MEIKVYFIKGGKEKMKEIVFVTHNRGKIASAQKEIQGVNLKIFEYELEEPRSDDVSYISQIKVREAYEIVKKPCISIDCGFFIDALQGFPKAFVNFALDTIGIGGILKLMENKQDRTCRFEECLSYYDGVNLKQFTGIHEGLLATKILGKDTNKKWSELWYIFIPHGYTKTLAQMTEEERRKRTENALEESPMKQFAKWYLKNET